MRLFEHADYEQAILQAAEHFRGRGLRPAIIEKDYLVTEALRVVAATGGDRVIFKGGTSLSKGWNLIQRFSARSVIRVCRLPLIGRSTMPGQRNGVTLFPNVRGRRAWIESRARGTFRVDSRPESRYLMPQM